MTRTHTVYFSEESLADLFGAMRALEDDAEKRRPHISAESAEAMDQRLAVLGAAYHLLREPVPESFA